jgi:hypothetical protein
VSLILIEFGKTFYNLHMILLGECSVYRDIKRKATRRYHHTLGRTAITKKKRKDKCRKNGGEITNYLWKYKIVFHKNNYGRSLKN